MDEAIATRVSAALDEPAPERSERRPQALRFSLRITTTASAKHLLGLLMEVLAKRGHLVEGVDVYKDQEPLARYRRAREGRV